MTLIPENKGIDHINVYSKSRTPLGRMLSNWYSCLLETEDGLFQSVEGYFFWLGLQDCPERDILRSLSGYKAKQEGTLL